MSHWLTPGAFLKAHRLALGLTCVDVALRLDTAPPVSAHRRAEWIADIEDGRSELSIATALALHSLLQFDWPGFIRVCAAAAGLPDPASSTEPSA